jgi:pimeloyl-ACP methyl ester carboxylesterase
VLAGAPHMMQVECPGAYAEAVVRFLNGILRDDAWPQPT